MKTKYFTFGLALALSLCACSDDSDWSPIFSGDTSSSSNAPTSSSSSSTLKSSSSSIAHSSSSSVPAYSSSSVACHYSKCDYLSKNLLSAVTASGKYTAKDSVAAYLKTYGELPSNYVQKTEAQKLYEQTTGKGFSSWNWNPWSTIGKMVGGDSFGNREGLLPAGSYYEADVDYYAANRGTNRLVYQTGEAIYSTRDHYESFSLIVWQ